MDPSRSHIFKREWLDVKNPGLNFGDGRADSGHNTAARYHEVPMKFGRNGWPSGAVLITCGNIRHEDLRRNDFSMFKRGSRWTQFRKHGSRAGRIGTHVYECAQVV